MTRQFGNAFQVSHKITTRKLNDSSVTTANEVAQMFASKLIHDVNEFSPSRQVIVNMLKKIPFDISRTERI